MKISKIKTTALSIPMQARELKPGIKGKANPIIVELTTNEGLKAFSIASALNDSRVSSLKASIDELKDLVIGMDISRWAKNWNDLFTTLRSPSQSGNEIRAIAVIDIAMWILQAKALGMPLARLLGGFRDSVPAYASDVLREYNSIDELQKEAVSLVKQGFRAMKMKIGGRYYNRSLQEDIERIKAVREAVGDKIDILIEAHWAYSVPDAIRLAHAIEQYHPYWFEDPIKNYNSTRTLAEVAHTVDVPIAAGESFSLKYGFRRLIEDRAADIIIVDLVDVGGITEWLKVAAIAEAWSLPIASHCMHDFCAHTIAAIPNGLIVEYMPWWDVIYNEPPKVINGCIQISDKPGIGLELNSDIIKKYEMKFD